MKKKLRTIQPAHVSEKFTVEEARAAWRKVDAEFAAREKARRTGSAKRAVKQSSPASGAMVVTDQET